MKKLDFKSAFKYPFNRPKGMWNILWMLLPIVGWFVLGGYGIRIIKEFIKGKFKKLPVLSFKSDLKLGFMMFLKSLPFIIVYTLSLSVIGMINPWLRGIVNLLVSFLVIPIITMNFFKKETIGALFEFEILKSVFNNLGDYVVALLKSLLLGLVFLIMFIVLVGIPANAFTKNIFIADFYRRRVK